VPEPWPRPYATGIRQHVFVWSQTAPTLTLVRSHRQIVPDVNPFANDAQLFRLTPFRETIKLEADMLIVSPIDHWWTQFRHRDVVISTGCRDWQDQCEHSKTLPQSV
jgi:hypothetical protein